MQLSIKTKMEDFMTFQKTILAAMLVFSTLPALASGSEKPFTVKAPLTLEEEIIGESNQVRVRIWDASALIICSNVGFQLDVLPNNFIGSKGSVTCGKNKQGRPYLGFIVNYDGTARDLETDGYE